MPYRETDDCIDYLVLIEPNKEKKEKCLFYASMSVDRTDRSANCMAVKYRRAKRDDGAGQRG